MNSDNGKKKKVLFIFGAGASYDAGAPMQGEIFQNYFEKQRAQINKEHILIKNFFQTFFLIDFSSLNKYSTFPTFEEVLGILEFATQNNASLGKNFPIEKIRTLREYIINLMAKTIKESLDKPKNNNHRVLIDNLFIERTEFDYSFINLNYDILLDNELIGLNDKFNLSLDYGIELWRNYHDGSWKKPDNSKIYLLKPHGSLNWFYCPSCNSIYFNVHEGKPKFTDIEPNIPKCNYCNSKQTLFIVPPTFFKTLTNLHITTILQYIQKEVANSDYLVFVGYSFPDADLHLKYIIKKALQFRSKTPEIIVIEREFNSEHWDAPNIKLLDVYLRYERIFKKFYFIPKGFANFSKMPIQYLKSPSTYHVGPEKIDFAFHHRNILQKYSVNEEEVDQILRQVNIHFVELLDHNIFIPNDEYPKIYIQLAEDFDDDTTIKILKNLKTVKLKNNNIESILIISSYFSNNLVMKEFDKVFYFEELSKFKDFIQRMNGD